MASDKKLNIRNKMLFLTYKSHINEIDFENFLKSKMRDLNVVDYDYILQHETGALEDNNSEGYEHSHVVLVATRGTIISRSQKVFDFCDIHPNIKKIKNEKALSAFVDYTMKEWFQELDDPNTSDSRKLFINSIIKDRKKFTSRCKSNTRGDGHFSSQGINLIDTIQRCNTKNEAIQLAKNVNEVAGILQVFDLKSKMPTDVDELSFIWQKQFITNFQDKVLKKDSRNINWFYDPIGKTGKTVLARNLLISFGNKWTILKNTGSIRDCASIIGSALDSGWSQHGIILDLPRMAENSEGLYTCLEGMVDGCFTITKYAGKTILFNVPHIVVFANFLPIIKYMSKDRWKIKKLSKINIIDDDNYDVVASDILISEVNDLKILNSVPECNI